ncbi:hypothetical protein FACS1894195_5280 [Bacteroidia bacterium]|nr:hypothetical protein FACS1894195_5280 [Bacteroidia bacterium]
MCAPNTGSHTGVLLQNIYIMLDYNLVENLLTPTPDDAMAQVVNVRSYGEDEIATLMLKRGTLLTKGEGHSEWLGERAPDSRRRYTVAWQSPEIYGGGLRQRYILDTGSGCPGNAPIGGGGEQTRATHLAVAF